MCLVIVHERQTGKQYRIAFVALVPNLKFTSQKFHWLCCGSLAMELALRDFCNNDRGIEKFLLDQSVGKIYLNPIRRGSGSHTTDKFFWKSHKYFRESYKVCANFSNKLMENTNTFVTYEKNLESLFQLLVFPRRILVGKINFLVQNLQ